MEVEHPPELDKLEAAYERLKAEVAAADDRIEKMRGSCSTCKFYRPASMDKDTLCRCPLVGTARVNEETGAVNMFYPVMRPWWDEKSPLDIPRLCGPNRDLWAPHEPTPKGWLRRFLDRISL